MHYGKSTFAKEVSQVTILPKRNPETELIPEIGQRDQLSKGDIRQTSKMYRCAGKAKKNLYIVSCRQERNAVYHRSVTNRSFPIYIVSISKRV